MEKETMIQKQNKKAVEVLKDLENDFFREEDYYLDDDTAVLYERVRTFIDKQMKKLRGGKNE